MTMVLTRSQRYLMMQGYDADYFPIPAEEKIELNQFIFLDKLLLNLVDLCTCPSIRDLDIPPAWKYQLALSQYDTLSIGQKIAACPSITARAVNFKHHDNLDTHFTRQLIR